MSTDPPDADRARPGRRAWRGDNCSPTALTPSPLRAYRGPGGSPCRLPVTPACHQSAIVRRRTPSATTNIDLFPKVSTALPPLSHRFEYPSRRGRMLAIPVDDLRTGGGADSLA